MTQPKSPSRYLVAYDSRNIFKMWIPHRREVISTRDVIFDEDEFFDRRAVNLDDGLVAILNEFVHKYAF
jgi:hypothetical protein